MSRTHLAIGPITARASWKWLGPHLAESLSRSCTVRLFDSGRLPVADVVIFIKNRPSKMVQQAIDNGCRIIYMPVDFYKSQSQIDADEAFLNQCSGLLVHSPSLATALVRHRSRIWPVDHPNLYGLKYPAAYRPDGYLLWVGDFLNLPYLLHWRERTRLPCELKILTNARHTSVGGMAMTLALARRQGVALDIAAASVNGIPMYEWNAVRQQAMMSEARAALDIKGDETDFFQFTKPPTKAQQFIVSGIPFAINQGTSIARDLHQSGFEVADVEDRERWFSRAYWESTSAFSKVLGEQLRPEAVAQVYQNCLTEVLGQTPGGSRPPSVKSAAGSQGPMGEESSVQWRDFVRAAHTLFNLGASWQDAAPHTVKVILQLYRSFVPGWVACKELNPVTVSGPTVVSVLIDKALPEHVQGAAAFQQIIPDTWEVVTLQTARQELQCTGRWKVILRWPFRGMARDRKLIATYANGKYIAFLAKLNQEEISRMTGVVAELEARPQTALVWWAPDLVTDIDRAANFVIRRDVWLAVRGYDRQLAAHSIHCCDVDLRHRVVQLGYGIEYADPSSNGPLNRPAETSVAKARSRFRGDDEVVIYTAITGGYDRLIHLNQACVKPARQIAFLDQVGRSSWSSSGNWEIRSTDLHEPDPVRQAKICKIRPDLFFPDADYSLWIDGNVKLIYPFDTQRLIELFLAEADMCVFRHHARSCIYQEAEACKQRRLDDPQLIDEQMDRYRQEGFPKRHGLNEAVVVLRRQTPSVKAFNELWWREICLGSRRDQLSFNYVQWKTGLAIAEFPFSIIESNGLFSKIPHVRRRSPGFAPGAAVRRGIEKVEAVHFGFGSNRRNPE